jgi:hypothetical protein
MFFSTQRRRSMAGARYGRAVSIAALRRVAVLALALLTVAVAAGCGSGSKGSEDPAAVVPARAAAYLEVTIDPEGAERDDALAGARKVLGTQDPKAVLERILRRGGTGKGEIEPWIGDRVAAFALAPAKGSEQGAIVATTSDADAAGTFVEAQGTRTQRYKDTDLHLDARGDAFAVVDDTVVAGQPAAVRAAVDAAAGDALADAKTFKDAIARAGGEGGIGRAYLAPRLLADTGAPMPSGGMFGSLAAGMLTGALPTAVGARLHADADALRADVAAIGGAQPGDPADPDVLAGVTGKAWLAAGIGDVGARVKEQLGASGALLDLLGAQAGLDIERDLLAWMGEGAVFAIGSSPSALGGALVVHSKDPAATRAAIPKLAGLVGRLARGATVRELHAAGVDAGVSVRLQGIPAPVQIAAAGDRFVIALGRDALREAITPSSRLGDDPDVRSAAAALGSGLRPTAFAGARGLTALAATVGRNAGANATELRQVLGRFTALVAADRGDGRWRAALGLR